MDVFVDHPACGGGKSLMVQPLLDWCCVGVGAAGVAVDALQEIGRTGFSASVGLLVVDEQRGGDRDQFWVCGQVSVKTVVQYFCGSTGQPRRAPDLTSASYRDVMAAHQDGDWVPSACTLPEPQRPLRVAEFHELFSHVRQVTRPQPTRLELLLPHHVEAAARLLAEQESKCCSFFSFAFHVTGTDVLMQINVLPPQTEVLDALQTRATTATHQHHR
ncbi:hypothetical protein ACK280_16410 [Mycobacterium sherrisii]|uniref:hypothetical protein n=1 Tax=Mycobacterium sherrisii TaxID=243061 RepID=UPI003975D2B4